MKRRLRPQLDPAQIKQLGQQILKLYTEDSYLANLLQALVSRNNLGSPLTPEEVQYILHSNCNRHQAIQTLKALGKPKAGHIKVARFFHGRRSFPTRLEWSPVVAREVINEVNKQLHLLAKKAEGEDKEAKEAGTNLIEMALAAGISEWKLQNKFENESWTAVAKMIAPGSLGGQKAQDSEETPSDTPDALNSEPLALGLVQGSEETPSDTPTELGSVQGVPVGTQKPVEPRFVDTKILLRPDLWVTLSLPKDLTESEAERLAGVVRNLWLVPSKGKESGTPTTENE
jgi:hypothetical protein